MASTADPGRRSADPNGDLWVFGYGSLIFRPDFPYTERRIARLPGYERRFWQGSHDHRGTPEAPGRVVTLIESPGAFCDGMAYRITAATAAATLPALDYREKNGYARFERDLLDRDGRTLRALIYIATVDNEAFAGESPLPELAAHIARSHGPSGSNLDYLLELADALARYDIDDEHVQALAQLAIALDEHQGRR